MEISFSTRKMQKDCSTERLMKRRWGENTAKKLKLRLTELESAETLEELKRLPQARCHEYTGTSGWLSVDLAGPFRLIIKPDHDPLPVKDDGGLDWARVTRVRIVDVLDPH